MKKTTKKLPIKKSVKKTTKKRSPKARPDYGTSPSKRKPKKSTIGCDPKTIYQMTKVELINEVIALRRDNETHEKTYAIIMDDFNEARDKARDLEKSNKIKELTLGNYKVAIQLKDTRLSDQIREIKAWKKTAETFYEDYQRVELQKNELEHEHGKLVVTLDTLRTLKSAETIMGYPNLYVGDKDQVMKTFRIYKDMIREEAKDESSDENKQKMSMGEVLSGLINVMGSFKENKKERQGVKEEKI